MNAIKGFIEKHFLGRHLGLRERTFRVILVSAMLMAVLGLGEELLLGNSTQMLFTLSMVSVVLIGTMFITFHFRKFELSSILIGVLLILVMFPFIFFTSGGIDGGATSWFSLGIMYCFLMFDGPVLILFLILAVAADVGCYVFGYYHPRAITPIGALENVYLDSAFGVIIIGLVIGLIMKYQSGIYRSEREIAEDKNRELAEVSTSKNLFFAKISHEIRTPINTIIGLNEINLRNDLPDDVVENCYSISNAGEMLLSLVNELLDISSIETSRMSIYESEYSTKQLFYNAIDLLSMRMKEKDLKFSVDIYSGMPILLKGDEKRIEQIVVNLLTNALKYTDSGYVMMQVYTEPIMDDRVNLVVSVEDSGMGIKREDLANIFDYFYRVQDGATHAIEGTGLGLAITKQLVDIMGGELTVDSIYTKGSTFTLRVPQTVVDATPIGRIDFLSRERGNKATHYVPSFEAPEARVLLVDDNNMNLTVAQKLLAETKVQIDTATSGAVALGMTAKKYYHVIFLDYLMPDMDGGQTLARIRTQENGFCRETPVICLTGNAQSDMQAFGQEHTFDGFIQKPVRGDQLEDEILKSIPPEIVEYRRNMLEGEGEEEAPRAMVRRRKKLAITTDSLADVSDDIAEEYRIHRIYVYIETENGRFVDTKEIDTKNISNYLSASTSKALAVSPSVEDYENFFANVLTEAEEIIHISLAAFAGESYKHALEASDCFGKVHVIDSGQLSAGMALQVISAARMAQEGMPVDAILTRLAELKGRIRCSFQFPSVRVMYQRKFISNFALRVFGRFSLRAVMDVTQKGFWLYSVGPGTLPNARKRFIRKLLRNRFRVNKDIVYITHSACSVKEVDEIVAEVKRLIKFKEIFVEQASVGNSCNAGLGTIGIAFFKDRG